jgi:membrane protease YdiL (CAAX protease family)
MITAAPEKLAPRQPMLVRVLPFLFFVALTGCQGQLGESSRYWVYLIKTLLGAGMVWAVRPWIAEMRWQMTWDAVLVGVTVFGLWVGLDGLYPTMDELLKKLVCPVAKHLGLENWCSARPQQPLPWNPHAQFGPNLAWLFVLTRLLGSALVVPPLEEVFYRSFLYRYIIRPDFSAVPLACFRWTALLVTAAVFGFAHYEWLPGILCGLLYQALVIRHNQLGPAMVAHGLTNLLLGLWIVEKGAWHFW